MNKALQIFFLTFLLIGGAHAQSWEWADEATCMYGANGQSIATDGAANAYSVGSFEKTPLYFGPSGLYNAGYSDIFISKFSNDGRVLLWARSFGRDGDEGVNAVAANKFEQIYVGGYFNSPTLTFDTTTLVNTDSFSYRSDIFVARFDSAGNAFWARNFGGSDYDVATAIAADAWGNVYVTGYFQSGTMKIGSTTYTNAGGQDMFLIKLDSNGNVKWVRTAGGGGDDPANSVSVDKSGNVFVAGSFTSATATFGTHIITRVASSGSDIYVAKYDSSGNIQWAKGVGNTGGDVANGVAADTSGNAYITGTMGSSNLMFGSHLVINSGSNAVFLAKYDPSGNVLWALSGTSGCRDYGYSVCVDRHNNPVISGGYNSPTITFGSVVLTNYAPTCAYTDIFIAKFDPSGTPLWGMSNGGNNSETAYSVSTDTAGNPFITGSFLSPSITFGPKTIVHTTGGTSLLVAKYNFCFHTVGPVTGVSVVCPGATIALSDTTSGGTWSSSSTGIATVSSSGIVTGVAAGIDTISYAIPYVCGVGNFQSVHTVTVLPLVNAGSITGPDTVCWGATITESDAITGGNWSSSNTLVASVSSFGSVTGNLGGTAIISYTVIGSCNTARATKVVDVLDFAFAGSIGSRYDTLCQNDTITLAPTVAGGSWSSSNGNVSVTNGVVAGITPGTAIVTYTVANTCFSANVYAVVTVNDPSLCPTAVNTPANARFKIYPNPSDALFYIDIPGSGNSAQVTFTDMTGRTVAQKVFENGNRSTITVDAGNLPPGSYIIKVASGDNVYRQKVTILK
jgi:hypothetical protein